MEQDQVALGHPAVERERQVHDRVLQPLAHPHRHDLHGRGVAVQSAVALGRPAAVVALGAQPVAQRGQRVVLAMRDVLQQLRHVRQVGHVPLAVAPRQHAVAHAAQLSGLEDRRDAALAGVTGPLPQRLRDLVGQRRRRRPPGPRRSCRRTSSPRRRAPPRRGAAGRTPPAATASRRRPPRRRCRSRRCRPTGSRPGPARAGTPGRPCASRRSPRRRPPAPACRRTWRRWRAGRRCRWRGPCRCAGGGRRSARSEFRCGRTSSRCTTRSRNGSSLRCADQPAALVARPRRRARRSRGRRVRRRAARPATGRPARCRCASWCRGSSWRPRSRRHSDR